MKKQKLRPTFHEEDDLLLARLKDLIEAVQRWDKPCFSFFLTEHEQSLARHLSTFHQVETCLWGGYPDAERRVFAVFPSELSSKQINYPFQALRILIPKGYSVSHRDALGSFMALGIKRETIGDILVGENLLVVYAMCPVADLILRELSRIGGVGVRCALGAPASLPPARRVERCEALVSSMRLDCVVAVVSQVSRCESARLISQGLVSWNAQLFYAPAKEIHAGDKISIRGFGKFQIDEIGSLTKKGRLHISYLKYC